MATRAQIAKLKKDWLEDPCWDIEDTDGFEEHRDDLIAFAEEHRAKWKKALDAALTTKAETMGCADNPTLARHLMALEDRLSKLEEPGS